MLYLKLVTIASDNRQLSPHSYAWMLLLKILNKFALCGLMQYNNIIMLFQKKEIDIPDTHIHNRALHWLGTYTLIKS